MRGTFQGDCNTGVVVNGMTAFTDGTSFAAVNVPLVAGDNVITAVATDLRGDSASQSVRVNGRTIRRSYDAATRTTTGTSPAGRHTYAVLNEQGRPIQQQLGSLTALAPQRTA